MKFKITLKDPDALYDAIRESVDEDINSDEIFGGGMVPPAAIEIIKDEKIKEAEKACQEWFKWGEYITVEVDTEKKTCTVLHV